MDAVVMTVFVGSNRVLYKRMIYCVYVYWRVCFLRVSVGGGQMIVTI
jgi:hypothetical protein